jgi:hypothetical protein
LSIGGEGRREEHVMRALVRSSLALAALAAGLGWAAGGRADDADGGDPFAKAGVYEGADLARMRAGDGDVTTTVANMQTLTATSEGNSFDVGQMTSGTVTIGGVGPGGFRGVGNFVAVTGNGNVVEAPVSVIISLE